MRSEYMLIGIISLMTALLIAAFVWPSKKPYVIVNMPADAKPLSTIPPNTKVIDNDRAILWWTVFKHMADKGYDSTAVDCANAAVKAAYPESK